MRVSAAPCLAEFWDWLLYMLVVLLNCGTLCMCACAPQGIWGRGSLGDLELAEATCPCWSPDSAPFHAIKVGGG